MKHDFYIGASAISNMQHILEQLQVKHVFLVRGKKSYIHCGAADKLQTVWSNIHCQVIEFDDFSTNPKEEDTLKGTACFNATHADCIIAVGGGSAMDMAKLIRYQAMQTSTNHVPLFAVPTTAGTAAEVTINYVITDVEKKRKFVCVDIHDIPEVAVVDPDMMASMPKGLTASTGMDALTHAIEGYITKGAWEMTDMFHLKAIELIAKHLPGACENTPEGREGMALAQYIAGQGFSNVGLGIVHSMAHGLGALYDTPHGVANAILLPSIMAYNAECTGDKYRDIAKAMGVAGTDAMTIEEARKAAVDAVYALNEKVGIAKDLKGILKEEDIQFLSESAFADACRPGNPKDTSVEEIAELYRALL